MVKLDIRGIYNDKNISRILLAVLFIINVYWFNQFSFNTLMGDDLGRWSHFSGPGSFAEKSLTFCEVNKYRPVFDAVHFMQFKLFSYDYKLFFYFNILFNFIVVFALFNTIKSCTKNNSFIAFVISIIYITSRFSYYNILQVNGILEALSLLLAILIVRACIEYLKTENLIYVLYFLILNCLITFTHERFIVLVPFLLMVLFFKKPSKFPNFFYGGVIFPFLLLVFIKKVIFKARFFDGTGGVPIDLNLLPKIKFFIKGCLNIFGLNFGPSYLNGISFWQIDIYTHGFSVIIVILYLLIIILGLLQYKKLNFDARKKQIQIFLLWVIAFFLLILGASVTFRQELRWLYAPFALYLILIAYILSNISLKPILKYLLLVTICLCIVRNDIYFRNNQSDVFFIYCEKISDSLYSETVQKYGTGLRNYSLYIEKNNDMNWPIQDSLFFVPYLGDNFKVNYVENIDDVDITATNKDKVILLRMQWPECKFINLTTK